MRCSVIIASSTPIQLLPLTEELPKGCRKKWSGKLILMTPASISFPGLVIPAQTLLRVGLALEVAPKVPIVFRTADGFFALGLPASSEQLKQWNLEDPWVLLPTEGLEITGNVEEMRPYSPKRVEPQEHPAEFFQE